MLPSRTRFLNLCGVTLVVVLAACSTQPEPAVVEEMLRLDGPMPVTLAGSWQRNYARDDDVNKQLQRAYAQLVRDIPDQRGVPMGPSPSRSADSLLALARIAEMITRTDTLQIAQTEHEISIEREDDFAIFCSFYNGLAKPTDSAYGKEICGWDGDNLVSSLELPGGMQITHFFTLSEDEQQLRVITRVASSSSRVPFTLRRFYTKYEKPQGQFNCIETLSMKRVCSTSEVRP